MSVEPKAVSKALIGKLGDIRVRLGLLVAVIALSFGFSLALIPTKGGASAPGSNTPLTIAFHLSSDGNKCFAPGLVKAIRHFATQRRDEINSNGGINGRALNLRFFDDFEDKETTVFNVAQAMHEPSTIAMIGVSSSTRGRATFEQLGPVIRDRNIPFITEMSLDTIFRGYPNVFTMASSVRNELDVIRKKITTGGYKRPVFVGLDDDVYSFALGDGVRDIPGGPALAGDFKAKVRNYQLSDDESERLASQITNLAPDLLIMSIHSSPSARLLAKLRDADITAPVVILLGRITTIMRNMEQPYQGTLSGIAREGAPHVFSERLRQRIWRNPDETWIFEDTVNPDTPGWAAGKCGKKSKRPPRQIFDASNRRAVGRGTQYRDMMDIIVDAARKAPTSLDMPALRAHIGKELNRFLEGHKVHKGLWRDWTFTKSRTAAEDTLLLTKSPGSNAVVLSPTQYQRTGSSLHPGPTLYTSIDLISLSRIDTNDQSFDAQFYLSMRSKDNALDIKDIEFTNAYRSPSGSNKVLNIREIDSTTSTTTGVRLYKVSGKFTFEPELGNYPFDTQRLSISFQAASTKQSFLIQPPEQRPLKEEASVDGWRLVEHYVGADQDIIPTIGASLTERRIVPFYKFNATWVTERIALDYYLRVVVPLCFIILVTYFSVFLPHSRFDSAMGIQVTALLSSIALYLALPKVDTDQATLSDKIFMMTYAAVSLMIGLSVLKDKVWGRKSQTNKWIVKNLQRVVFPVVVIATMVWLISTPNTGTRDTTTTFAAAMVR